MNTNGDSYVTANGQPFPDQNGYYVNQFEVKMFGIPKLGGDAEGDNIGDPCGITDLIPDEQGFSVYARRFNDANNNIMFRFRVGNNNPSVEAWTILLDIDGKFGFTGPNADPNATAENPGFELDLTLIKRSNAGVFAYNIDGTDRCGTPLVNYPISGAKSYFQIAVADITTCGDLDYFYDFYVPFNEVASLFNASSSISYNLTGATPLRYASVTNTSATCAMDGKIADVSGIDDADYPSIPNAFIEIINAQCGTPINDLEQDGGFNTELPYTPKIDETTVVIGSTSLQGTVRNSVTNAIPVETLFVRVQVFAVGATTPKFEQAVPVINGVWTVSLLPTLSGGLEPLDKIKVRVQTNAEGTGCGTGSGSEAEAETDVPPDGVDDAFQTNEETSVDGNVFTNDKPLTLIATNGTYSLVTPPAHGSLTFRADGAFTYTPFANFYGTDSFIYKLCVTSNVTTACDNTTTVTITVSPIQDSPIANDDNGGALTEDGANGIVDILLNDRDPDILPDGIITTPVNGSGQYAIDLDLVTSGIQNSVTNATGVWTLNVTTGIVTFDPANNYFGTATTTYRLFDPQGAFDDAIITFVVSAVSDDAPVANDDIGANLAEDGANGTVNILLNDTDPDGDPTAPINGTNQFTVDLDLVTPGIQTAFTNATGVWTLSTATGIVTFNPADNYYGTAVISYRLTDPQGLFDDATITFNVTTIVPDPLVANDDNGGTLIEDGVNGSINILLNDRDPDILPDGNITTPINGAGQYTVDLDPTTSGIIDLVVTNSTGVWSLNTATGLVTYDPANNYFGTASITYRLCDPAGSDCDNAIISFVVTQASDAPVANNDVGSALIEDGASGSVNILTNDTDPDGNPTAPVNGPGQFILDLDPVTAGVQTTFNSNGIWTLNTSTGVVTYDPADNYNGTAVITYRLTDPTGLSDDATITFVVTPVSDNPVAVNDSQSTNEDTPVTFSITANDTDVDGTIDAATVDLDPSDLDEDKTFIVVGQGNYSVNASGNLTFTPLTNFFGTATPINYTVKDNEGNLSNVAQIQIIVNLVNNDDAPNAVDDVGSVLLEDGANGTVNILINDTDPDGNPTAPVNGLGQFVLDLDPVTAGVQTTFNSNGIWTLNTSTGLVTYDPADNYNGTAVITYALTDPTGLSDNATITFVVTPVADNPVAVNDFGSTNQDTPVTFSITVNDYDIDGTIDEATVDLNPSTPLSREVILLVTGQGNYEVDNLGNLTFTPLPGFTGATTPISYTVKDNDGNISNTAQIFITVISNNSPVAVDDNAETDEDKSVSFSITANDRAIVGSINSASVDLDPSTPAKDNTRIVAEGTFTVDNNGIVTFVPVPDYSGTVNITYNVEDSDGNVSNTANISVIVNPVNDAPFAQSRTYLFTNLPINFQLSGVDLDNDPLDYYLVSITTPLPYTFPGEGELTGTLPNLTFTPDLGFTGTVTFTFKVNDGTEDSNIATITLQYDDGSVSLIPVAVDDIITTNEDQSITFLVIANDTDANGFIDPTSVDLDPSLPGIQNNFTVPGQGVFTADNSGWVTFVPVADFNGIVTPVDYQVKDNDGNLSNIAQIKVTVSALSENPVAVNDNETINEGSTITFSITDNDYDPDGGTIDVATADLDPSQHGEQKSISIPGEGSYEVDASGDLTFTPVAQFSGTTSITYTVKDNDGNLSNEAQIQIIVLPVNDPPVAVDDIGLTLIEDGANGMVNIIANDTDPDGNPVAPINGGGQFVVDLDPGTIGVQITFNSNGVWTLNTSTGEVTFNPADNYFGTAVITYTLTDPTGLSDNATITFEVTPVPDNPIAVNDSRTTNEEVPVTFSITANDTDADGTINATTVDLDPSENDEDKTFSVTGQGVYIVDNSGNLTFTPAPNYFGVATPITYTVKDNEGNVSNEAIIQITVLQILNDDAPVAVDDAGLTLVEDGANGTINIIANDTDPDGNPVAPINGIGQFVVDLDLITAGIQTTFASNGVWTLNTSTGVVTYDPADNYTGTSVITYRLTDPTSLSDDATITFEVTPVPDNPVAVNDSQTTNEEQAITFSIIANDYDVDGPGTINAASVDLDPSLSMPGEQKTITIIGEGTYQVDAAGNLTFTPVTDYYGIATPINYTIEDVNGNLSNEAQIQVTVLPVNDLPIAFDDIFSADEDVTTIFTILITANDTDIDGNVDPSTVDLDPTTLVEDKTFTLVGEGTYTVDNTGKLTFLSALNYNGTTTPISYTVKDNSGGLSNTATIQIQVNPVNDLPVVDNATVHVDEDNSISVCVTYTDVEGDPAVLSGALSLLQHGTAVLDPLTGELCFKYTPEENFNGSDQVEVVVCDKNEPDQCSVGVITVIVDPVNDPPRVIIDNQPVSSISLTTPEDTPLNFDVDADDLENDNISVSTITNVSGGGTLIIVPCTGTLLNHFCFLFTPEEHFNGKSIWTVKICDDGTPSLCQEITIEIDVTPVQDAPIASTQSVSVEEDTSKEITLTGIDADGDGLTYTIVTLPAHGTLSCLNCSNPVYTPNSNYNGPDSFTFIANDGFVDSAPATVSITVTPVNDPPIISPIPVLTTPEDVPLSICFGITDLDGDEYIIRDPVMVSGGGTMTPDGSSDFCFTFTPDADYFGPVEWTFIICDNANPSLCTEVKVVINVIPVDDAPIAVGAEVEVKEDEPATINLIATDVEGDELTYSIIDLPQHGTLSCTDCPNPVYTPNPNYNGPDSFTFKANDGIKDSNIATITINVAPVNDPPIGVFNGIAGNLLTTTTTEDTPLSFCFDLYDEEGNTISSGGITQVSGGGTMVLGSGGVNQLCFTFTPAPDFNGISKWEISACDDGTPSACGKIIIEIDVTPVNDAPVAVNDNITVRSYEKSEPVNIILNDTDIENDNLVLTTTALEGPFHGTVSLTADGLLQYQSELGYMGTDSVRYQVCDSGVPSLCDVAVVFIEVGPAPFKIYNGLSPNGDGLNDYWRIDGIEQYPNNTIRIFDRFNNLIFETTGYSNEGNNWTGQTNHSMVKGSVQEGTYFYSVELGDGSGLLSGFIVLKKN